MYKLKQYFQIEDFLTLHFLDSVLLLHKVFLHFFTPKSKKVKTGP